jgi:hypothetical protein
MKRLELVILSLLFTCVMSAQQVVWNVDFDVRLDNHEFAKMDQGVSKTLFGLYIAPTVGFGWDENIHSLNVGADLKTSFGLIADEPYTGSFLAYYRLNAPKHKVYAGIFPTGDLFDDFSTAFISDQKRFTDRSLEGVAYIFKGKRGYVKAIFDMPRWSSDYLSEILTLYSSSKWTFGGFSIGYLFDLNHYAYSINTGLVVDNYWLNPFAEFSFGKYIKLQKDVVNVGGLLTAQRDRTVTKELIFPMGFQGRVTLQKWNVGIDNTIYLGDNLMPYWGYEELYHGSEMYRTQTGLYNRLECYYEPYRSDIMDVSISWIMHTDGVGIGWQQKAKVCISLDSDIWKSMVKLKKRNKDETK